MPATLMLMNRTPGCWKMVRDAVVKSEYRVPIPITTSARRVNRFAAGLPVAPTAPRFNG